jgi:hypothetical protein
MNGEGGVGGGGEGVEGEAGQLKHLLIYVFPAGCNIIILSQIEATGKKIRERPVNLTISLFPYS